MATPSCSGRGIFFLRNGTVKWICLFGIFLIKVQMEHLYVQLLYRHSHLAAMLWKLLSHWLKPQIQDLNVK